MPLRAIAFDIVGTAFPLDALRPGVVALGLPPSGLEGWFAAGLRDAFALAAAGDFKPFSTVLEAALNGVRAEHKLPPQPVAVRALVARLDTLKPRPGLAEALTLAGRDGRAVLALSNGSTATTETLLASAGVSKLVTRVVSVDEVAVSKPRAEVYRHAARAAGVEVAELALVAAHPWDINGAAAAGCRTAYLSADRPFSPAMRAPDAVAGTLPGCVEALLAGAGSAAASAVTTTAAADP